MATARRSRVTPRVSTRVRRTSPRQGPRAPMHLVERMQVAVIGLVNAYVDRLMREIEPALRARFDAEPFPVGPVGGQVALGHQFLETMFRLVDRQAAEDLGRVIPISTSSVLPRARKLEHQWIENNTELIRLEERARAEIRKVIEGPLREGIRVEEVRARIEERLGVVRSRAEFIARDQTLKLYGQIQQARQTAAGIEEYTWSTSEDERVRPDHAELEGTAQRWDDPPVVDDRTGRKAHPGGDFNCRCAAIPILPDEGLEEQENPPEPEPVTPPEPANEVEPPTAAEVLERERQRLAEERAAREAEAARQAAERERQERVRRVAQARETLERHAERVQIDPATPLEIREAAAGAVEKTGLRQPLNVFKIADDIGADVDMKDVEGLYLARAGDLRLRSADFEALGVPLPERPGPGQLWSMSSQPATQAEAARNTVYHELGHHAHMYAGPFSTRGNAAQRAVAARVDALIQERWRAKDREYLTDYAQYPKTPAVFRASEYFAEAFAAYHAEPAWLRRVAPKAYDLVREVLRLRKESP